MIKLFCNKKITIQGDIIVPNIKSQIKRVKTNEKSQVSNNAKRSRVRNMIQKFNLAIEEKNNDQAKELYAKIISLLDRAYYDGIYHKNTVARKKSSVSKKYI